MVTTRPRVFYGWYIVAACATIHFYVGAVFFAGFGTFFSSFAKEFGWSRAVISGAFSLQRLEGGFAAPIVGFLLDRFGPRQMMVLGMAVIGGGFLLLSRANALWNFYLAFFTIATGISLGFGNAFSVAVVNWFVKKRSRALGLSWSGGAFSGFMLPLIVLTISQFEWRTALVIWGLGVWAVCIPAALVVRNRPEPYGLLPDGDASTAALSDNPVHQGDAAAHQVDGASVRDAMGSRTFWLLALAMAGGGMATSTLLVHQIPYLESVGFSKEAAASMVSFYFFLSLGGRLGVGWMGDIIDKRRILAAVLLAQSIGILTLSRVDSVWLFVPYLVLGGLAHGATVPLRPALLGEYFGRAHFGAIQGLFELPAIATGVIGPIFAGWVFDTMDTYRPALIALAAAAGAGIPLVLLARKPEAMTAAVR